MIAGYYLFVITALILIDNCRNENHLRISIRFVSAVLYVFARACMRVCVMQVCVIGDLVIWALYVAADSHI